MAQFGAPKNPPWARDNSLSQPGVVMGGMQQPAQVVNPVLSQPGIATPTVFSLANNQPTMAPPTYASHTQQPMNVPTIQAGGIPNTVQLPQPGIAIPTTLATTQVATVSYPTPRAAQPPSQQQPKQRVFTGTVTKLHDNFGFVDEDVFFQTSCVKGSQPKVGDRVLVEAAYNANMPFKWNATRIQVLPNQVPDKYARPPPGPQQSQERRNVPALVGSGDMSRPPPPLMGQHTGPPPGAMKGRGNQGGKRDGPPFGRDRDRSGPRDRDRHHDRGRSPPRRQRSRSPARRRSRTPTRARSPQRNRRPVRVAPRYMVQIPKLSLDTREANVIALKGRYTNMYVPSDFFNASFSWVDAFPTHRPFGLGNDCTFHVMHKEVDSLEKHDATLEPADADHLFSAKVMLLSCTTIEDLYHKSCALTQDPTETRENFQHPARLLQFLVGLKGKSEPMAIGGPWSPSLDGANPADDPSVLINTAKRVTRALTGIDLSNCTQWYRFLEIRYHRPAETHKGRAVPARVETTVIFLPDIWNCKPSRLDWISHGEAFKKQLSDKMSGKSDAAAAAETQEDEEESDVIAKADPTHYSKLDPKIMKVSDLRSELEARVLSPKGLKSQLIARLTKAIKTEQEKEEEEAENKEAEEEEKKVEDEPKPEVDEKDEEKKKKEEEDKKRREERERVQRERRYQLPENPSILVHPSTTAKSGKFECSVMSLSVLLDYRPDDNKEHTFEVSLFAELFNEMLMRDFGFKIYKALLSAPEKPKEEKKKDKDKKEDGKDEKKDGDKDKKDEKKKDDEEPAGKKRKLSEEDKKKKDDKKDDKEEDNEDDEDNEDAGSEKSSNKDSKDKDKKSSKDKDKKKEKIKYKTVLKDLLLAFVYFDQSHTGYLLDKDVEELLHTIGLQLSRAQVKKLVAKVVARDTLNYRKLTDKPEKKEGEVEKKDESMEGVELDQPDEEEIAQGNRPLLMKSAEFCRSDESPASSVRGRRGGTKDEGKQLSPGMVMFKGAVVDVNSVMSRLEKSEKTKTATEAKLKEVSEEFESLKSSFASNEQSSAKVTTELSELKKKLRDQRKATDSRDTDAKRYHDVIARSKSSLAGILEDMRSVFDTKDKESKSEVKQEVNGE